LDAHLKEIYYPILLRENQSLLIWASLVGGQTFTALVLLGWNLNFIRLPKQKDKLIWVVAGVIIGFITIYSGSGGSLPTNAPVPFLYVLIITLIVLVGAVIVKLLSGKWKAAEMIFQSDVLPLLILWLLAFFLWSGAEIAPNYFIDSPRPPNFTYTPTSDAIYYEIQSQRFLAGEGFDSNAQHSLYGYFISGLHRIAGENYLDIYRFQIAILALIPFFLFKLASRLGSNLSGWLLAGLVIIREYTALLLGDTITVSNVQVLMTEPLATLGVVLVLYLGVSWLMDPKNSRGMPVLIGGVIGLVVLIRVELLSLVIVLGIVSLIMHRRNLKTWFGSILMIVLTMGLVITPWIVRNYQKTGTLTLDKRVVLQWAVNRYTHQLPEEGQINQDSATPGFLDRINLKSLRNIGIHTGSSLQQSLLYLPSNHLFLGSLDTFMKVVPEKNKVFFFQDGIFSDRYNTTYIKSLPYWHINWDGEVTPRSVFPMLLVFITISLGIYQVWKKHTWIGFIPLLLMVLHIVIYAFFIGSGGRYIQIVDWIMLMYFSLGLSGGVSKIGDSISNRISPDLVPVREGGEQNRKIDHRSPLIWQRIGLGFVCILIGISMPIVESSIIQQYTYQNLSLRLETLTSTSQTIAEPVFQDLAEEPEESNTVVFYGKALYPNFFEAEERILDDRAGRIPAAGIPRTVFYLVGTNNIWISLPTSIPPEAFAHGSEVILLGEIIRNTPDDLKNKLQPYVLADELYLFNKEDGKLVLERLTCSPDPCSP
ncbi:MAG: hypothetical protein HQ574_05070, partial [Chloroflexi bacterium]|nr:hypothetical protein [Chloroflexota bacterium]